MIDPAGKEEAEAAAGEREHDAFGEQLPNEPSPARADGEADGDLFPLLGRAREEQVGEIHAGQQQDQTADDLEHPGKGKN